MQTVVILGARGMAGHVMAEVLDNTGAFKLHGVAREPGKYVSKVLDVQQFDQLQTYLEHIKPDVVINCVGVLVASASTDIAKAVLINSYLPHFLADLGNLTGFKLVHISTDCVFSGKTGAYQEDAFRDGDDTYARTKALGEVQDQRHLTLRTSIIGPELKLDGTGLLDWFFKQNDQVVGYTKAFWSGVTTLELAKATRSLLKQNVSGLVHLCPGTKISKYELLKLFNRTWRRGKQIIPFEEYCVDKSLVCTRTDYEYNCPDYSYMLDDLRGWTDSHSDYYKHYQI